MADGPTPPEQHPSPSVDDLIARANAETYTFEHGKHKRSPKQWFLRLSRTQKILLIGGIVSAVFIAIIISASVGNSTSTKTSTISPSHATTDTNGDGVIDQNDKASDDTAVTGDTNGDGVVDSRDDSSANTTDETSSSWWSGLFAKASSMFTSSGTNDSTSDGSSSADTDSSSSSASSDDTGYEDETAWYDPGNEDGNEDDTPVNTTLQNISYTKIAQTPSPTGNTKYANGNKNSSGSVIDTIQGGTTDGTYIYFAYENPAGGGVIAKFNLSGKLIKASSIYSVSEIGHANALGYDSQRHQLVMPTFRANGKTIINGPRIAYINPESLQITKYTAVQPKAIVSNVCYNAATDRFVSNGRLYDAGFKLLNKNQYSYGSKLFKKYSDGDSLGQGIGCNARYIYVIRYYPNKTNPHTHVYVFNWSGKLTGVYNVQGLNDEAESIFIMNGQLYMGVNNGATYLGKNSDNKNDYFIRLSGLPI